ncbi:hypothetical protein [Vibrio rumoiensis]|uniref:Lipoprotein n=1 Tax=Vibrio rumoiensis TaxID=76258 RepID=A0ABW7IT78_9VIBR
MRTIISISLMLLLTACSNQFAKPFPFPQISLKDDTLIYKGMITGDGVLTAQRVARNSSMKITKLQITSPGGMIEPGIELGYFIKENNLDLILTQLCFSACANYLLPAAHSITIQKDTLLGWHGGARQSNALWKQSISNGQWDNFYPYLERLRKKEYQFFQDMDVAINITTYGQTKLNTCQKAKQTTGWYYTLNDMKSMGLPPVKMEEKTLLESVMYQDEKVTACLMPEIFNT